MSTYDEKTRTYTQVILKADQPTINGNIYTRECLEKAVAEYNSREKRYGPVDIDTCQVKLKDVGFEVERLRLEGSIMSADIKLLTDAPNGEKIRKMLMSEKHRITCQCMTDEREDDGTLKGVTFTGLFVAPVEDVDDFVDNVEATANGDDQDEEYTIDKIIEEAK